MSQPGETLLYYRLIEKIGEGGMGVMCRNSIIEFRTWSCMTSERSSKRTLRDGLAESRCRSTYRGIVHEASERMSLP